MKKMIMLLVFAAIASVGYAQTKKGDTSIGFMLGYAFESENAVTGVDFRYNVIDEVRLAPRLSHYIKNNHLSAWTIDMDAHYIFQLSDMFGFYPLGGLSLTFWDSYGRSRNRLGLNVGLGCELYATKDITVGVEMKYNVAEYHDQAFLGVRIGYNF